MQNIDRRDATIASAGGRLEATFSSGKQAPAAARAQLSEWLDRELSAESRADALLLVSELVANSVRHAGAPAGAPVRLTAELMKQVLRLEVTDTGHGGRFGPRAPDFELGHGFGLQIVDSVAERWGIEDAPGTRVWCELTRAA